MIKTGTFSNKVLIVTLLILYIYAVNFNHIPLSGKMILGVMGILSVSRLAFPKPLWGYIIYPAFLVIWGGVVTIVSGFFQFKYNVLLSFINAIFASCFIYKICKLRGYLLRDIIHFFAVAVFVESTIALLLKLSPSFNSVISVFVEFPLEKGASFLDYYRFVGLGSASYFGVMPSCALGLFSCAYLLLDENNYKRIFFYYCAIFTISVVSVLTARSCFVLVILSFLYYIICKGIRRTFATTLLLVVGFYFIIIYLLPLFMSDAMASWFFDAFSGDSKSMMESSSGQSWMGMLERSKMDLATFLWGDGAYIAADGIHYYKETDIGYARQLFYYGIVGLVANLLYQYRIVRFSKVKINSKKFTFFLYGLYISYLIMLAKGDISMADYFILIAVISYFKMKEKTNINIVS